MAKTKGPDWNPRTLSTFSTFGGGTPSPDALNGDRYDEDLPLSPHPLVNGGLHSPKEATQPRLKETQSTNGPLVRPRQDKGEGKIKREAPKGAPPLVKASEQQSPDAARQPSDGASPAVLRPKRPVNFRKNHVKTGTPSPVAAKTRRQVPDSLLFRSGEASNRSSGSSGTSGASSVPEVLSRPDIVLPFYNNHVKYKDPIEETPPSRSKGTKVAPPIVPVHAYSKSLVGEESPAVVPCHGYSRSMGEDQLGVGGAAKFKDGSGEVSLFLGPKDRRFGFSVVGGSDEKVSPRIDEIAKGSPADKADLEVGDEILEVNGKSLEDATHTEVISHIHQCIRSRTICLRVKRRTGNKLAADLAASSNVQDAFVIAVEQRARERLERLSALKKIKPVDMTKLSTQLSESPPQQQTQPQSPQPETPSEDANSVPPESSPIYVTSVPNLTSSSSSSAHHQQPQQQQRPPSRTRSRSSTPGRTSSSSPRHRPQSSSSPRREPSAATSSSSDAAPPSLKKRGSGTPHEGDKSGDELELTHDLDRDEIGSRSEDDLDEDEASESGESLPATPEKTYGLGARPPDREAPREVLLDSKSHVIERPRSPLEYTASLESKDSSSSRKSGGSGSSSGGTAPSRPLTSRGSSSYPDRGFKGEIDRTGDPQESMISMVEFDPANKEMAVDVPDTFVGRTKTPPRYPPPKPQVTGGYTSSIPNNNNNNSSSSKGSSKRGTSLSSGTVTPVNGTLSKPVSPPVVPDQYQPMRQDVVVHSPNSQEEVNKLKRYEEEIKQRREREEEMAELQRSSIRGSQKLQSLASYPQGQPQAHSPGAQPTTTGVVNQAYDQEDLSDDSENKGSSPSINELIQSLQRIQNVLKSNGHRISEDMNVVAQLLVNPEFQKVLAVHNKVQETWCLNRPPTPLTFKTQELVSECMDVLNGSTSPEALELVEVLSKYPVEGLFYAHDRIADSEPPLEAAGSEQSVDAPPPKEVVEERETTSYPEENVRIVRIDKTNEPLGATIRNEGDAVVIGRIVQGGAAEKSGRLHEGDEILEVNGIEVRGKSVNDVCDMLAGMTGTLTFIISPSTQLPVVAPPPPVHAMHVKAYFDYDPEEDLYIPCRELGMSFQKGDILHVMNQQDPNWWQAYRDGEEDQSLAGLIPSKAFQQQREAMRQTVVGDTSSKEKSKKGKLLCAKKHQKKKKKKMLYPNYNEDYDAEEILTYEEVALYFPRANRKRPIVLIGPPNIGRHELRQKLMEDTDKFAAAVPHTSRPKRDREVDGQDYHFISRTQFEADILARKFVEHGEFEKAYYGTSLDAIRAVVNSGKICVLNLHPLSLKMLKNSDLMPYVVLIAPPSLEKLRQKKQKMGEPFKEDDLKETIQKAREMEDQYGHYFDLVLINQDVERTYQQLIHEINVLEREPQWVPAAWLANER